MKTIEFMGMPRAGKTTALEYVESYLKHEEVNVRTIYEGARISPLDKSNRFEYHSWSFHNTINRVLESKINNYQVILIDRGILDHIAFLGAIKNIEKINFNVLKEYYKQFLPLEDSIIYFEISPEKTIERERKHKKFLGRVFNENFLRDLNEAYKETVKEFDEFICTKVKGEEKYEDNLNRVLEEVKSLIFN